MVWMFLMILTVFIHCCVKKKISMRSGETDKAEVIYDRRFNELAQKISAVFKHIKS